MRRNSELAIFALCELLSILVPVPGFCALLIKLFLPASTFQRHSPLKGGKTHRAHSKPCGIANRFYYDSNLVEINLE